VSETTLSRELHSLGYRKLADLTGILDRAE